MRRKSLGRRKGLLALFLVLVGAGGIWWRVRSSGGPPARFALVRRGTMTIAIKETGTVEPTVKVSLKSKVSGRVLRLTVREGDWVRKGQVVALIDPTEIRRQVHQLEAELTAARARLSQARVNWSLERSRVEGDIEIAYQDYLAAGAQLEKLRAGYRPEEIAEAEAEVERIRLLAEEADREAERQRKLFEEGLIARREAEAELKIAESSLQKLLTGGRKEEIAAAEAERKRAESVVEEAQANLENARANYERKRLLFERGFISRQEADSAEVAFRSATARLKAAMQDLESAQQREAMVRTARSEDVEVARVQVERAQALVRSALATEEKNLDSALTRQKATLREHRKALERLKLLRSGSRPEDIRNAEAQLKRAEAAWKRAILRRRELEVLREEIRVAYAQVRRLEEQKANLETQLQDTVIRSPIAGIVIKRSVEEGELVASAISAFAQGTEMMVIADLSRVVVKVRLNEVDVAKIRLGQPAQIRLEAIPERKLTGVITKIAPAALSRLERTTSQTPGQESQAGWFDVEIFVKDTEPQLRLGMSANVDIICQTIPNTLLTPIEAVIDEDSKSYALVVTDDAIARRVWEAYGAGRADELTIPQTQVATRRVTVGAGMKNEAYVQVLSGLKEGDVLLIKPPKRRVFQIQPGGTEGEEEEE